MLIFKGSSTTHKRTHSYYIIFKNMTHSPKIRPNPEDPKYPNIQIPVRARISLAWAFPVGDGRVFGPPVPPRRQPASVQYAVRH